MASIDKRPNGRWRVRYRERPGGPQRARHFDAKTDAERLLARIQGQLLDGSYIDPTAGQTTVAEYAAAWQKSQLHRPHDGHAGGRPPEEPRDAVLRGPADRKHPPG